MSNNTALADALAALNAATAALTVALSAEVSVEVPASTREVQPKADPKFRTAKQIAKGSESAKQIWARHYAAAGVRRFKDLTPAQQKAAKAEVAAAWKGIKGTRKTPVAR